MACYNVLLVDDEKEVCQVIIRKLDWESMGFHIVGYAANGVEALEMAEELQPDVVMTDIKMPYMDGLTLSKKLKEAYQKIKIIIFSGFDEFEYAKEAIKVEATEYILKPINESELREVFERVKTDLDRELDERRNIDKLRQYYLESLPVLQENFYITLLEGRLSQEQIEETLKNYQIQWAESSCIVTILHISSKNLLIHNGRISGIIDIDWMGAGDKLTYVALTNMALLNMEYDTDYVTYILDEMQVGDAEKRAFLFYTWMYCVDFMGERGMQFMDKTVEINKAVIDRLNRIYDDYSAQLMKAVGRLC